MPISRSRPTSTSARKTRRRRTKPSARPNVGTRADIAGPGWIRMQSASTTSIWRQFVACQMPRAEYTSTTVTVEAADFELRIRRPDPAFRRLHAGVAGGIEA